MKYIFIALFALAASINAATIFSDDFAGAARPEWSFDDGVANGILGELNQNANVSSVALNLNSSFNDSNASLQFDLLLFRTIDGTACCTDTFSLTVNGATVFQGTFTASNSGVSISTSVGVTRTFLGGGVFRFTVDHALNAGNNSYVFGYSPLQSLADEAWGLDNVSVSAVPEPSSYLLGFLAIAFFAIRKK